MASQITNYQCPACNGPLQFSADTGKLQCNHCGSPFEVAVIEQMYAAKEAAAVQQAETPPQWDTAQAGGQWSAEEAARLRVYACPSCGAELMCDDTTLATACPYCDNPTVVPAQVSGALRPDYVIPFRLDKNAAKAALGNHYKGKPLLPSAFSAGNRIEEIKGIYVPFWLYDAVNHAQMQFRGTVVSGYRDGDEQVTTTDHFQVVRQGSVTFEKVPVDGLTKMPDTHMDAIEPFHYQDLQPFSTAYLPGFLADKYDLDAAACCPRAHERIRTSTQKAFESTAAGYAALVPEHVNMNIQAGAVKYVLLPVWMLNTNWNGKKYLFAMNGQTGKLIGDLPVDWRKAALWFGAIALPLMAILGLILF